MPVDPGRGPSFLESPAPQFTIGPDHIIDMSSLEADQIFGGKIVGHEVHDFVTESFRPRHREFVQIVLEEIESSRRDGTWAPGVMRRMVDRRTVKGIRLDGQEVDLDIRFGPRPDGRPGAIAVAWDVSELFDERVRREQAEAQAAEAERKLRLQQMEMEAQQARHRYELDIAAAREVNESRTRILYVMVAASMTVLLVTAVLAWGGILEGDGYREISILILTSVASAAVGFAVPNGASTNGRRLARDRRPAGVDDR